MHQGLQLMGRQALAFALALLLSSNSHALCYYLTDKEGNFTNSVFPPYDLSYPSAALSKEEQAWRKNLGHLTITVNETGCDYRPFAEILPHFYGQAEEDTEGYAPAAKISTPASRPTPSSAPAPVITSTFESSNASVLPTAEAYAIPKPEEDTTDESASEPVEAPTEVDTQMAEDTATDNTLAKDTVAVDASSAETSNRNVEEDEWGEESAETETLANAEPNTPASSPEIGEAIQKIANPLMVEEVKQVIQDMAQALTEADLDSYARFLDDTIELHDVDPLSQQARQQILPRSAYVQQLEEGLRYAAEQQFESIDIQVKVSADGRNAEATFKQKIRMKLHGGVTVNPVLAETMRLHRMGDAVKVSYLSVRHINYGAQLEKRHGSSVTPTETTGTETRPAPAEVTIVEEEPAAENNETKPATETEANTTAPSTPDMPADIETVVEPTETQEAETVAAPEKEAPKDAEATAAEESTTDTAETAQQDSVEENASPASEETEVTEIEAVETTESASPTETEVVEETSEPVEAETNAVEETSAASTQDDGWGSESSSNASNSGWGDDTHNNGGDNGWGDEPQDTLPAVVQPKPSAAKRPVPKAPETSTKTAITASHPLCVDSPTISPSECQTLVNLYEQTQGTQWRKTPNWLNKKDPCRWQGVTCENNKVVRLMLNNRRLQGMLPNLDGLASVRQLSFANNQLTGTVPDFSALKQLLSLRLDRNQLTGALPNISTLPQLRILRLKRNQFTGMLPDLSNNTALEHLDLSRNQLTGNLPDLSMLSALEKLDLSSNGFTGAVSALPPSLRTLVLSANQFKQLPDFSRLIALKSLHLADNQFRGELPVFTHQRWLESLNVSRNQFSGALPSALSQRVHLKFLQVQDNQFTGPIPNFSGLKFLEVLHLQGNKLCGAPPAWLYKGILSSSRSAVKVANNRLTVEGLDPDLTRFLNEKDPAWVSSQDTAPSCP